MKLSVGIPDYDCYQIGIAASEKARVFTCYRLKNGRIVYDILCILEAVCMEEGAMQGKRSYAKERTVVGFER